MRIYTATLIVLALLQGPALVRRALELAGISHEEAYRTMGISQPRFSKWLSGVEPIQWNRLTLLPPAFQRWFHLLGIETHGLPVEVRGAALVRYALRGRKHMARVSAPDLRKVRAS